MVSQDSFEWGNDEYSRFSWEEHYFPTQPFCSDNDMKLIPHFLPVRMRESISSLHLFAWRDEWRSSFWVAAYLSKFCSLSVLVGRMTRRVIFWLHDYSSHHPYSEDEFSFELFDMWFILWIPKLCHRTASGSHLSLSLILGWSERMDGMARIQFWEVNYLFAQPFRNDDELVIAFSRKWMS